MKLKGLRADRLIIDDPYVQKPLSMADIAKAQALIRSWTAKLPAFPDIAIIWVNGDYVIGHDPGAPMTLHQEILSNTQESKQRFGRVARNFHAMGELRRQVKAPHKEILYVWAKVPRSRDLIDRALRDTPVNVLKAINKITTEQLVESIRNAGKLLEEKSVTQVDAEFVLDLLYAELQNRTEKP